MLLFELAPTRLAEGMFLPLRGQSPDQSETVPAHSTQGRELSAQLQNVILFYDLHDVATQPYSR